METPKPVSIQEMGDKYIMDTGRSLAGWAHFRTKGRAGDGIRFHFMERLELGEEIFTKSLRDARCTDMYIASGHEPQGVTWALHFVYHGFRHVEISGYPDVKTEDFAMEVVEDEMGHIGSFSCSNKALSQVTRSAPWGIRSNYKGMPVDCPRHNERQPWLGDYAMGYWGESMFLDSHVMYNEWARGIREAQREDDCILDAAPAYRNYYSNNVTWPATLPLVRGMLFTDYGNIRPIEDNYSTIKKWVSHIREYYMTKGYIITRDRYGD